MSELKPIPCPICKLIPHVNENKSVLCYRGTSPKHRVYAQTIEQWNTRPIEDALRAENAELLKQVAGLESALIGVEHVHMDNEELRAENAELREKENAMKKVFDEYAETLDGCDALRERIADLEGENKDWLKSIAFLRQTKAENEAQIEALLETMRDALENCEQCRGQPLTSRCARCQTFAKLINPTE